MVSIEEKKLNLIAALIKEDNEDVLKQIEEILSPTLFKSEKFADFSNKLSAEELNCFEKNIEDGCGQINTGLTKNKRIPGGLKGKVSLPDDFNDPLEDLKTIIK